MSEKLKWCCLRVAWQLKQACYNSVVMFLKTCVDCQWFKWDCCIIEVKLKWRAEDLHPQVMCRSLSIVRLVSVNCVTINTTGLRLLVQFEYVHSIREEYFGCASLMSLGSLPLSKWIFWYGTEFPEANITRQSQGILIGSVKKSE